MIWKPVATPLATSKKLQAAAAFRQRFITLNLNEDAGPESVVMELTNLFNKGSELVQ